MKRTVLIAKLGLCISLFIFTGNVAFGADNRSPRSTEASATNQTGEKSSPLSIPIGAAEFTPGGFLDFTSVYRSKNVGSSIGTSFGSTPFDNTAAGKLGETRFSAQNSRLSLKVTASRGHEKLTGYVEADFLGALPGNGYVTSNSNSLRMRLYWVDIQRGKWEILAGQSWSLLTPNRVGLSALPSDIFYSLNVDTNYQVGLTWSRDPQFRLVYHANKNWTAGVSLENPQQYVGGAVQLPSSFYSSQLDNNNLPNTPNLHPDVIGKISFDGHAGRRVAHFELAGLFRGFRVVTPQLQDSTSHGYGGSFNANLEVIKNFRFILTSFLSQGGGRYIFGLGPDVVVRPDGKLSAVRSASGIGGFEYQVTGSTMLYGYYGGAYFWRNFSLASPGQYCGFGYPGSSSSANRSIQEVTSGVIRTFWKNPNYGALQLLTQYSYLERSPWAPPSGGAAKASAHLIYADLRYVLP
jgi:hypothetical protein